MSCVVSCIGNTTQSLTWALLQNGIVQGHAYGILRLEEVPVHGRTYHMIQVRTTRSLWRYSVCAWCGSLRHPAFGVFVGFRCAILGVQTRMQGLCRWIGSRSQRCGTTKAAST